MLASAAALVFAGLAPLTAAGQGRQSPAPGQYPGPPSPLLENRGHSIHAASGSYCWGVRRVDGYGLVTCVDMAGPPATDTSLPARGKRVIAIDMEIPTERLTASLSGRRLRGPVGSIPPGATGRCASRDASQTAASST
jgi:hypothetical protein